MIRLITLFGLFLSIALKTGAKRPEPPPASTLRVDYVAPTASLPRESSVIFADDFDAEEDFRARYFEYDASDGHFVRDATGGYGGRGGAMKCLFEKGQVSAGSLKTLFGRNPFGRGVRNQETFREVYWRLYVRHEPGWEGNPAKLARATCLASPDWSQGFIAHVWGGKGDVLCIDPASGIRDSRKVSTKYNDFEHLRWLGMRDTQTPIFSPAESGRWVCVESHVKLNTPGQSDGVFQLWIDGRLEASRTDLDWHGAWQEYAINAVFVENYWNEGSEKRQARWFDNLVISTQPIGPVRVSGTPTLTRTAGECAAWQAQAATDSNGQTIVWESKSQDGKALRVALDGAHGTFRSGRRALPTGATCWLRLRQKDASGAWSAWTAWHSPFHRGQ